MDLNTLWFILIAVLFIGFFILEGFDYGVGMITPFLGKTDEERRLLINSIGPFWDANEVWFITAGGALFAAFPNWYATLFSGFYVALFLLLIALMMRGVAFEFRSKLSHPSWRSLWDWAAFTGSLLPPFLWGVALANFMHGVPIDQHMNFTGSFWDLLNPYALLGGISLTLMCLLHGALFLTLRFHGELQERARNAAKRIGIWTTLTMFFFVIYSYYETDIFQKVGLDPGSLPVFAGMSILSVPFLIFTKHDGWAFLFSSSTIAFSVATVFFDLFPRVMISSLNPAWDLTIYNAAGSHYSLTIMSIVAVTILPIVILYQAWTYWVFRHRLQPGGHLDY
ncbi:cytochrome d ubiquinol oxidase subunit II [Sulfoacidibacillus thermotolerans]|uniref:Cytochrome d ubiquinol oxidase subunit II n=1 Tax=Sulfoacidibacillus thermotolerans TaxID=1765684 RepID=A0A2U3D9W9_SULT2|nr:cytochrome d ubiquinol oxidase subunit II [Sulfoacidibacillus thermotolerans]PWI58079.1 cytochrome d ubiquinol oxidase subunit II [Sulfoacidibacillus thermotolerans]